MIIEVTQEDIDKGVKDNNSECPIARAIKRALGTDGYIHVWNRGIGVTGFIGGIQYKHTKATSKFMKRFDNGLAVKPFKFKLIKAVK